MKNMKVQSLEFGSCQLSWSPKPQEMKEIWPHILPISSGRNQFKGKKCIKVGWKIKIPLHLPNMQNFRILVPSDPFLYAHLEAGRIMWLGMAGVHTGFRTITLVLYIGSLPNLATWLGRTLFILGLLGHCYYKYNFWQQGHFRTITLVLYIGSLTNLATWLGRTLFILGSLGQSYYK
jgi:hypothetical protein